MSLLHTDGTGFCGLKSMKTVELLFCTEPTQQYSENLQHSNNKTTAITDYKINAYIYDYTMKLPMHESCDVKLSAFSLFLTSSVLSFLLAL